MSLYYASTVISMWSGVNTMNSCYYNYLNRHKQHSGKYCPMKIIIMMVYFVQCYRLIVISPAWEMMHRKLLNSFLTV